MTELLEPHKTKLCLEITFDDDVILQNLSFSAKSQVLGGSVSRVDFEGDVFDECDFYRDLLDGDQIAFLLNRNQIKEASNAIFKALKKMIDEIKFEESLDEYDKEDAM